MFRKPVSTTGEHAVSGADKKKLKRALAAAFGASDEALDQLLPPKADLRVAKVASPSRASLYFASAEGGASVPLFVDTSGKGDYVPTVFALWRCPTLLPPLVCKHSDVSAFLVSGADLMSPGVSAASLVEAVASSREGALFAVFVPGNPCAVGVGALAMPGTQLAACGGKGRLLNMVHVYRDCLWAMADTAAARPNDGFLLDRVIPIAVPECDATQAMPCADANDASAASVDADATATQADDANDQEEAQPPASEAAANEGEAADMDALLDACLLQALRTRIKDKDLPLQCGALLTTHLLPCRPAGTHVDLKRSSFKKLGRFLHAKAADGLLTVREDKRTGDLLITGVNRRHPALAGHVRHTTECESASGSDAQGPPDGSTAPLVCEEWWTPSGGASVKPVFVAMQASLDAFYSTQDATAVLDSYISREGLDAKGSTAQRVALDPVLWGALFPRSKASDSDNSKADVTEMLRHELVAAFLAACGRVHTVRRGDLSIKRKGALPSVRLKLETRSGGKRVTILAGLEPFLVDVNALASELRERCASSVAVADLPRPATLAAKAPTPREVVVQGECAAVVAHHLTTAWHIPPQCVPLPPGVKPLKTR